MFAIRDLNEYIFLMNSEFCAMLTGYSGQTCAINVNECDSNPCLNGATCTDSVNGFTCQCVTGETCWSSCIMPIQGYDYSLLIMILRKTSINIESAFVGSLSYIHFDFIIKHRIRHVPDAGGSVSSVATGLRQWRTDRPPYLPCTSTPIGT